MATRSGRCSPMSRCSPREMCERRVGIGSRGETLIAPQTMQTRRSRLRSSESLASGARQVRLCERRTPEGQIVWEEVHASPILDSQGKLLHVVEVWRDISDRRAAEAHLAESHRLASLGTLASGFSHELNTPLATVLMCVEGILRETSGDGADEAWIRNSASIAREQILRCAGSRSTFCGSRGGSGGRGKWWIW